MITEKQMVDFNLVKGFAEETNAALLKAWAEGNKPAYTEAYKLFASFLGLPLIADPNDPNAYEIFSATNGASLGFRHRTTKDEDRQILKNAVQTHELISQLPVSYLQGMLLYFLENSFPKLIYAAALAQTASMAKSINESVDEIGGKGKSWFVFAASATVRDYIQNYGDQGILTGDRLYTLEGLPITTKAQLDDYKGAAVIINHYPEKTNVKIPEGLIIKGGGISYDQYAENYVALGYPGIALPVATGNASIIKLRATNQDSFEIFRTGFLHDADKYMQKHPSGVAAVNTQRPDTREAILRGLVQSVTSRGWEQVVNSLRIVSGMEVGHEVFLSRQRSDLISEEDKAKAIYELAGGNVVYIHDDVNDEELQTIVNQLMARLIANQGMTCTRADAILVKKGPTYDKFVKMFDEAYEKHDLNAENTIGNPHDPANKQGGLSSPTLFKEFQESLDNDRRSGARVTGGRRLHEGSGGTFTTLGYSVWPERAKNRYEAIRSKGIEVFAPKTNIVPVNGIEDAVRVTNLNTSGLSSAVYSHDPRVNAYFLEHANVGSVNYWNPKGSSDNSSVGGHIATYHNAKYTNRKGEERVVDIPENGPTGTLSHIANLLNAPRVNPDKSSWVARHEVEGLLKERGIILP